MKIHFAPTDTDGPTGVVSFASWNNRDLQGAIRQAFCESSREQIVELWIAREGIKAVFQRRDACQSGRDSRPRECRRYKR